jgi:hypothetical protein
MAFMFLLYFLQGSTVDWDLAIKRNSEALKSVIAVLFALLGLDGIEAASRIPRSLHNAVLGVLRPAESAVRRLIVIAARNVVVKLAPSRPMQTGKVIGKGGGSSLPSFQLFDPRKRFKTVRAMKFTRLVPRIHVFGYDPRVAALWPAPRSVVEPPPQPDGLVNAERLSRRLQALKSALGDLPRQAKRLARWQQRRKASPSHKFLSPLRSGHPPGYRRKPIHEVDEVLIECDGLAWEAMKPDTI